MMREPLQAPRQRPTADQVPFPVLASEKLDGVRCLVNAPDAPSPLASRQGRPIRNRQIHARLAAVVEAARQYGLVLDGELWAPGVPFDRIRACVQSCDALADWLSLHVFDAIPVADWLSGRSAGFAQRLDLARSLPMTPGLAIVDHIEVADWASLLSMEAAVLDRGGEGLVVRRPDGRYLHGRLSLACRNTLKIKPSFSIASDAA